MQAGQPWQGGQPVPGGQPGQPMLPPPPLMPPPGWHPAGEPMPRGKRFAGPGLGLIAASIGVVLALVVAGFVIFQFVFNRGGAGSPEEAAAQLVDATTSQDPLAFLNVVAPAETEGLTDAVKRARDRAEEEGVAGDDSLVDAIDIQLEDLEWDVDELSDSIARVSLTGGHYEVSWDPGKLPDRLDFRADATDKQTDSGDIEDLLDGEDAYVMTVKQDGRWYVTALGTAAEYGYQDEADNGDDLGKPDYDAANGDIDPIVGDSPEKVFDNIADAVSSTDFAALLANLPDDLGRPLLPYAGVVEDFWKDDGIGIDVSVSDVEVETEDIGDDRVRVTITKATVDAVAREDGEQDSGTLTIDGKCATTYEPENDDRETFCFDDGSEAADGLEQAGIDSYDVVMKKVDGGYQLDPIATLGDYALTAIDHLDEGLLDDWLKEFEDEV